MFQIKQQPQGEATAQSPCINICALDASRTLCIGCFRTLDEIAAWSGASNAQRLEILSACANRRPAEGTP